MGVRVRRWSFAWVMCWVVAGGCTSDATLFECVNCACTAGSWERVADFPSGLQARSLMVQRGNGPTLLASTGNGGGAQLESWFWDGLAWIETTTGDPLLRTAPESSVAYAAVHNTATDSTVLFDGRFSLTMPNPPPETWVRTTNAWTLAVEGASMGPALRIFGSLAYDPSDEQAIMFGGFAGSQEAPFAVGTWAFRDSAWTELVIPSPPLRALHAMATDEARGEIVLFGGGAQPSFLNDTWTFSDGAWSQRSVSPQPPARHGHGLVYDRANEVVVLFGGAQGDEALEDVWAWDGSTWGQIHVDPTTESPGPRAFFAYGYDPSNRAMVIMGSAPQAAFNAMTTDTWLLRIGAADATTGACCGDGVCQFQERDQDMCPADCG